MDYDSVAPGLSSPSLPISTSNSLESLEVGMRECGRRELSFCYVVSKLPEICGYKENTVEPAKPSELSNPTPHHQVQCGGPPKKSCLCLCLKKKREKSKGAHNNWQKKGDYQMLPGSNVSQHSVRRLKNKKIFKKNLKLHSNCKQAIRLQSTNK